MKVLVTGANGMLGQDLCPYLENIGCFVIPTNKEILDITNKSQVKEVLHKIKPDLIIHCAAYTDVEKAQEEKELASKINIEGTKNIATYANEINSTLIYISTDYVFNGKKTTPYKPNDKPNPINHYGYTKYLGELEVQKNCKKYYIARTSWLYGLNGKNFVETIIKKANKGEDLYVINDQAGCPTWTYDLIQGLLKLLNQPYGIYHITGDSSTTWHNFACEILKKEEIKVNIFPCTSEKYKTKAKRPKYSVLKNHSNTRNYLESLDEYLKLRKES